jgi:hypothetical protein
MLSFSVTTFRNYFDKLNNLYNIYTHNQGFFLSHNRLSVQDGSISRRRKSSLREKEKKLYTIFFAFKQTRGLQRDVVCLAD